MRQIITQATAARIREVSRQRINELMKEGRFTVPVDGDGDALPHLLYLDEVLNFEKKSERGRPRLSDDERALRQPPFAVGDRVVWHMMPKDGYGYRIIIIGKVVKVSAKKLKLEFLDEEGEHHVRWADATQCEAVTDDASDNEQGVENSRIRNFSPTM